jgi:hypothetical protein
LFQVPSAQCCLFIPGTVTSAVDVAPLNKARTDIPQDLPVITGPHSFMSFILASVYTGHLEDNADKRGMKRILNIVQPNILLYVA